MDENLDKNGMNNEPDTGAGESEDTVAITDPDITVKQIVGYDPMTGEPIYEGEETKEAEQGANGATVVGYDPMTGEPIYENARPAETGVITAYDPMTGEALYGVPDVAGEKSKKKKTIGMALAGVAVIALVIAVILKSGVFLSKPNKVLLAIKNTVEDEEQLTKTLKPVFGFLQGKDFSGHFELKTEDGKGGVDFSYKAGKSEKAVSGSVDVTGMPKIDGTLVLTDETLNLHTSVLDDNVYRYNYKESCDSIAALVGSENLENFNDALSEIAAETDAENKIEDILDACVDEIRDWEFKEVSAESCNVDGKERKCKGYQVTVASSEMYDLLDIVEDNIENGYLNEMYDEMRYELRSMPETEMTFYLYKNKLACVEMELYGGDYGRGQLTLEFLGGKSRWQNMRLTADNRELLELEGENDGSVETLTLKTEGERALALEYNKKSDEFELKMYKSGFGVDATVTGTLHSGRNNFELSVDSYNENGRPEVLESNFWLRKGAEIEKLSGKVVNVNKMNDSDIQEIVKMAYKAVYGVDYYDDGGAADDGGSAFDDPADDYYYTDTDDDYYDDV